MSPFFSFLKQNKPESKWQGGKIGYSCCGLAGTQYIISWAILYLQKKIKERENEAQSLQTGGKSAWINGIQGL